MRAKKQNFFVRENELFLRISENIQSFLMHLNAKLIEVDCRILIPSFLVILARKVYMCEVFGASLLSFSVLPHTAALICGQMMTPPLKLLRKRNQHQISVINHLFIYSFSVLCLTNITLGLHLQSLLEVRKDIYICTMNTFCQLTYSILTG